MAKQDFTAFVYYVPHAEGGGSFHYTNHEGMQDHGWVLVTKHQFSVDIPDDFDPREQVVAALKREQQRIRAEMSAKVKALQDRINSLLALEMS